MRERERKKKKGKYPKENELDTLDNTDGKRVWAGRETKRGKQKTAARAKKDLKLG